MGEVLKDVVWFIRTSHIAIAGSPKWYITIQLPYRYYLYRKQFN